MPVEVDNAGASWCEFGFAAIATALSAGRQLSQSCRQAGNERLQRVVQSLMAARRLKDLYSIRFVSQRLSLARVYCTVQYNSVWNRAKWQWTVRTHLVIRSPDVVRLHDIFILQPHQCAERLVIHSMYSRDIRVCQC